MVTFYNCVAISQTGDPTAPTTVRVLDGGRLPQLPKVRGVRDSYIITTREFGPTIQYGIGVYGLERQKMIKGNPNARVVSFFIDGNDPDLLPLVGDGLLPPDMDGSGKPKSPIAALLGTQDDNYVYGATSDAVNIGSSPCRWNNVGPTATLAFADQLAVDPFDSDFPCAPTSRDCLPQPGIVDPNQYIDILSYRQRPTWRNAYRKFVMYETMVTNQSVEASPGVAGVRWYEIRG